MTDGIFEDTPVFLLTPEERDEKIGEVIQIYGPFISIDATKPVAVNGNMEFYREHDLSSIFLTTGGDRDKLRDTAEKSNGVHIIIPNASKHVMGLQTIVQDFSYINEGELDGFNLYARESHQGPQPEIGFKGKADTSGTAKVMLEHYRRMGASCDQINKIRLMEDQLKLGVPEEFITSHGWHTYWLYNVENGNPTLSELGDVMWDFVSKDKVFQGYNTMSNAVLGECSSISPDKTVFFDVIKDDYGKSLMITHNINGKAVYVNGALYDALPFAQRKIEEGVKGKAYMMEHISKAD